MEDLNQVSLGFTKGIKQLTSLELDEKYKVLSAKITQGRYGKTVLLELEQNVVFLPKRYVNVITQQHIENFNSRRYAIVVNEIVKFGDKETAILSFPYF